MQIAWRCHLLGAGPLCAVRIAPVAGVGAGLARVASHSMLSKGKRGMEVGRYVWHTCRQKKVSRRTMARG